MNNKDFGGFMAFLLLLALWAAPAVGVHWWWQDETVNRGLAQYCPETGNWAWLGECTPAPSSNGGV
jgi:hypothetical protein